MNQEIQRYYISTKKVTGYIETDMNMKIILAPPIWRRFIGKSLNELLSKCYGEVIVHKYGENNGHFK
jgi:hypothetical protein